MKDLRPSEMDDSVLVCANVLTYLLSAGLELDRFKNGCPG